MVEPQIVVLDVAGSNPVDHPIYIGEEKTGERLVVVFTLWLF